MGGGQSEELVLSFQSNCWSMANLAQLWKVHFSANGQTELNWLIKGSPSQREPPLSRNWQVERCRTTCASPLPQDPAEPPLGDADAETYLADSVPWGWPI